MRKTTSPISLSDLRGGVVRISREEEIQIEEDFVSQSFVQQVVFIFRAFSHIFELGVSIFMLVPPTNVSL